MLKTIFVTGSGGFIGSAVAKALRDKAYSLRAGYRKSVPSDVADAVSCDLDDSAQISAAIRDVDVVVHCAYGNEQAMVQQCRLLLEAMSKASVTKIVYFSSISVHGEGKGPIGHYAQQKALCEALIEQWCTQDTQNRAVILRPGIVYGAQSHLWIGKLSQRIQAGVWGDFGKAGQGPATLIHIDDLTAVTAASVDYLLGDQKALIAVDVVGPQVPTWNEYFHALAAHVSQKPLPNIGALGRVTLPAMGFAAKVLRRFGVSVPQRALLAPTKGELAMFARQVPYDATMVSRLLGYRPSIDLNEGLKRSFSNQETRPLP